jgi:hypothetical protein
VISTSYGAINESFSRLGPRSKVGERAVETLYHTYNTYR